MAKHNRMDKESEPSRKPKWRTALIVGMLAVLITIVVLVNTIDNSHIGRESTPSPAPTSITFMKQGALKFLNAQKTVVTAIDIEIAEDDAKREQGLMYRNALQDNQGMLFVFYEDDVKTFWMKNTPISLDMIFINASNQIVTIHKQTTPFSEEEYASTGPARYVLEVNAGFTEKHNVKAGDYIKWERL